MSNNEDATVQPRTATHAETRAGISQTKLQYAEEQRATQQRELAGEAVDAAGRSDRIIGVAGTIMGCTGIRGPKGTCRPDSPSR